MSKAATRLQFIRSEFPSKVNQDHLRETNHGVLYGVLDMTNGPDSIIDPSLKEAAIKSQGIPLEIPIIKKGNVTIRNTRTCDVQCQESSTTTIPVTWKTVVFDICMVPSQYKGNDLQYGFDFSRKIKEAVEAVKTLMETDLISDFETAKNQVYSSSIVSEKYTPVANALQVSYEDRPLFFNDVNAINFADEFDNPNVAVMASHALMPTVTQYTNQGDADKLGWQLAGKSFTFSNRITDGSGVSSTAYLMPKNAIGLLTRTDVDSQMGYTSSNGTEWGEDVLPNLPFTVGVKYDSTCSDQSALEVSGLTHLTSTLVEHYQFSFDYARILQYNENPLTDSGSIRKVEFLPKP